MSSGQKAQSIKGGQHRLDPVRAGTPTADPLARGSTDGVKRSRCPLLTEWMLLRLKFAAANDGCRAMLNLRTKEATALAQNPDAAQTSARNAAMMLFPLARNYHARSACL